MAVRNYGPHDYPGFQSTRAGVGLKFKSYEIRRNLILFFLLILCIFNIFLDRFEIIFYLLLILGPMGGPHGALCASIVYFDCFNICLTDY